MTYHLYQRTITYKGKSVKAWYYWFYDENKKQVRKSCGKKGDPCLVKRDAQAYIASLPDEIKPENAITFNDFCKNMYDENSPYMIKQINKGHAIKPNTLKRKRFHLNNFLNQFGTLEVKKLQTYDVENWLLTLDIGNSMRNGYIEVIQEIYKELYVYHLIDNIPLFERYKRIDTKDKGILYPDEIKSLFPDDYDTLISKWHIKGHDEYFDYQFATLIYTIVSTGMRSGEIRALKCEQFVRPDAILINAMIDGNNQRITILKKGTSSNKKWRVVILPEKTTRMLQNLKAMAINKITDYVFEYKGKPFETWFLLEHFRFVLDKNKIDWKQRNIGIHSLRFTYDTLMKPEINNDDLRLMIGHTTEKMTDYYDKSKALDHLDRLLENKAKIDGIFN